MLLGYNQQRPGIGNYNTFLDTLTEGLQELGDDRLSLMVYGSYVRGEMDVGRSDIDALMLFDGEVVLDKKQLALCSKALARALLGNNVPFQVTLSDMVTMRDGRFNSYNPSFAGYFKDEAVILVGPDYRGQLKFEMPQHPEQGPLTFNLRKCRQGLFFAEYDQEHDYESFLRKFTKSLDAVSRGSKQVLFMADGQLTTNRFSALHRITQEFPLLDPEPLIGIKELYNHPEKLDALYTRPQEVLKVWNSAVSFLERMIGEYIKRFPNPSKIAGG